MKHVVASLTIGASLLLPSAGVVFAADPHLVTGSKTPGRPGGGGVGISCQGVAGGGPPGVTVGLPPGQIGSGSQSPFVTDKQYAGTAGAGNSANAMGSPQSQYDVACFQHP
jgi:hypothetical protein